MTVEFSLHVVGDIDEITGYIARDNRDAASRFYIAFDETVDLLRRMPGIGAIVEPRIRKLPGLRLVTVNDFKTYILYYQPQGEVLRIVRVLHHARDRKRILRDQT